MVTDPHQQAAQGGFNFDPAPEAAGVSTAGAVVEPERRELTVTALHTELKRTLNGLGEVRVSGEVHGVKQYPGGGRFLTLKDRAAQISVRVPPNRDRWCRAEQGESVVVTGRMETFTRTGSLTLTAASIDPLGAGAVAAMIVMSRDRLRADGLLDRPRRSLPLLPRKVGLVCGNDAAVLHDIRSVIERRFPGYCLVVVEVPQSSAESIVDGIAQATADPLVDVVIIARGGGDATALLPYSNEQLCRAVAACRVPVVSAIGHEIDRPLCDEIADARAATPSVAAALVVPDRRALQGQTEELRNRSWAAFVLMAERARNRTDFAAQAIAEGPARSVDRARNALDSVAWARSLDRRIATSKHELELVRNHELMISRLAVARASVVGIGHRTAIAPSLVSHRARLSSLSAQIESLSPRQVLARGFAVVTDSDGLIIRDASQVHPGDRLQVRLTNGLIEVDVVANSVEANNVEA